ncbi:DAGAT-domain-containing protein [Microstroma glucosiphilum]|uniref:Diacylglycerol O-acyltransferase n=1 Tax=Pseudomicrostroma glucosiphilum TaxID=1684307 RepID=A0A316UIA1_9BASI|nr:DAGAT-domain-containing protein [Pseudomicrostroma glucosiphilum]PWN22915.1 DAGAT-domain-containing protein [Pseudomicrostroma glucosiphilum]
MGQAEAPTNPIEHEDSSNSHVDRPQKQEADADIPTIIDEHGREIVGRVPDDQGKGAKLPDQAWRFAPLSVPRQRRLQTLGVLLWGVGLPVCVSLFFLLISLPPLWPLLTVYLIWMWFDDAHESGGRKVKWVRRLPIFKYFAEYFPVSLIKTADLPPDRPYIFGYHPHGIIGMGAVATFATEALEFSDTFPGIEPRLLTLASNFKIPIYRDLLLAMGLCSVSRRSCERALRKGKGSSITIVVGGAAESLNARPGTADLVLKRRLGFIKIAMKSGADLVPVFAFGENDIYEQLANEKGTKVYTLQKRFQAIFGFTLPLFHGRGVFNYNFGFLPFRHPIVSVVTLAFSPVPPTYTINPVGRPIHVTQSSNPTKEQLDAVQKEYIAELNHIWDTWKDSYAAHRRRELTIVD